MLDRRGLYGRLTDTTEPPRPVPQYLFGGFALPLDRLAASPVHVLPAPQVEVVRMLARRAGELGVDIRWGHSLTALRQDAATVTVTADGPTGARELTARYLVGADGATARPVSSPASPSPGSRPTTAWIARRPRWSPPSGSIPQPARSTCPVSVRSPRTSTAAGDPSYRTIKGILAAGTETAPALRPRGDAGTAAHLHGPAQLFADPDAVLGATVIPLPTVAGPAVADPPTATCAPPTTSAITAALTCGQDAS